MNTKVEGQPGGFQKNAKLVIGTISRQSQTATISGSSCGKTKPGFLTSDLKNRNKKQRTLIVRRAGYPAGAALVGIGKKPKPRDSRWMFCSGSEFGNWLQMALGFGKNLGLFLPSPKTQALCDFEKRSGVRIGLESLFRSNLFHQDHHLQYGSRPWWSMTGNSNWWVGIESSQSGMSS